MKDVELRLLNCAANNDVECIKECIRQGVDINIRDEFRRTPVMIASQKSTDVLRYLIDEGADLDCVDGNRFAAINIAAFDGDVECLKLLVDAGVDVNHKTIGGETPLMHATINGHVEIVKYLVRNGAVITQRDDEGRDAVRHAIECGRQGLAKQLIDSIFEH